MMFAYLAIALFSPISPISPISPAQALARVEPLAIEQENMRQLLLVRRVFVDRFSAAKPPRRCAT